ncbi:hypothetical protein [Gloeothece verrucosa]|uniref:NADH-ubiquinone oxidoreductase chain 2 n=1 Tax=Gloeothece verrucosa (strain PCC 7822) TaxID=497965 RepID=E0UNH5_GLOV7|nr:hypothetical protein [Gloeothece verrucosa]ADN18505.1 NADH-ubiquinone oxidoreductase chain 2 [Gloeothece verrucosa PCC 7822]
MINQLRNLDNWLSYYFPSNALDQLLTPSIFLLIFFVILMILNENNFKGKIEQPSASEFFLLFGLGVIGVLLINFRWGG